MQTNVIQGFRLSPQQRHLWSLLESNNVGYQVGCCVSIVGELDPTFLKASFEEVVARHEILRTTFQILAQVNVPLQVIHENGLLWEEADLSGSTEAEREISIARLMDAWRTTEFSLENGPLLKIVLVRLEQGRAMLLAAAAALCSDLLGIKNVISQATMAYGSRMKGGPPQDPPLQYADVSEYFGQLVEANNTGAEYWSRYASMALQSTMLPFQKRTRSDARPEFNSAGGKLDAEVAKSICDAADKYHTTPEVMLLTAWHALLWRMMPSRETVVAVAFHGRKLEELAGLPGPFVKYLPLECHIESGTLFSEVLEQVSSRASSHSEWQDFFNWKVCFASGANSTASYIPVAFEYSDFSTPDQTGEAVLFVEAHYALNERFDLRLSCTREKSEYSVQIHYDAALFAPQDVEIILEQFCAFVACAAGRPDTPVERIKMLTDAGYRRMVSDFNRPGRDYSGVPYVQCQLEEHARSIPESTAAVYQQRSMTYRELNARANQVANYLLAQGIGPDSVVGIYLERSLDILPAVLGVLKAGGAYLPLDPRLPEDRLAFMLADSGARIVLAQEQLARKLKLDSVKTVVFGDGAAEFAGQPDMNPDLKIEKENLAYVIYTSGSTGQPKGVMVCHEGLRNYLTWCTGYYRTAEGWGSPLHSTLAFDLTVTSLFSPLVAGRKVVLVPEEDTPEGLDEVLRQYKGSSFVKLTPSHVALLNLLLTPAEKALATKALVIGGESLHAEELAPWQAHAPNTRLINEYGPTETVVGCSIFEADTSTPLHGAVPIGRPIDNTSMYVLDDCMSTVPFFVAGEICIGGSGVARGYLRRPSLTAERFVPNPFATKPGERLYRTGDIGRYRGDGSIEFLGRADDQVKIKGYRIELGEIEAVLREIREVQEAVVVAQKEKEQERLVAYLAPREGMSVHQDSLRSHLEHKLPGYMVPSAFVVLSQLPLTPNGKIDRKALHSPDGSGSHPAQPYAEPRTAVEKLLADLWAKALGRSVGIHDNFFELGGDSILSIQIAHRALAAGVRLSPRQIFRERTIAGLARSIEEDEEPRSEKEAYAGPVPITPIQKWFFEQDIPNPHHWNQSVMLELTRPVEPSVLEGALRHLNGHHDAFRLRFQPTGDGWRQTCVPTDSADTKDLLTQASLASVPEQQVDSAIEAFAAKFQKTLNVTEGPVIRAALIDLGPSRHPRLLLAAHHLVVDIVSWTSIFESLQTSCEQLERRQPVQFRASTAFSTWARQLEEYATSEQLDGELEYWLSSDRRWACKVPVDHQSGANTEESARTLWVALDAEATDAMLYSLPKRYHTMINDVLLAALVQAFSRWTRSRSLLIDLEGHGREDIMDQLDISHTVGWFTCIFPVVLDIGEAFTPQDCLKKVKVQVRSIPNGGIGYGLLRYMRNAEVSEELRSLPQAEISFNYVGRSGQNLSNTTRLFVPSPGSVGPTRHALCRRRYLIEINGGITGGQLRMAWTYSEHLHKRETIELFAAGFIDALKAMIEGAVDASRPEDDISELYVPGLQPKELDNLIAQIRSYEDEDE